MLLNISLLQAALAAVMVLPVAAGALVGIVLL
jgi:hypothetical protein